MARAQYHHRAALMLQTAMTIALHLALTVIVITKTRVMVLRVAPLIVLGDAPAAARRQAKTRQQCAR